jgi:hypothetical protein
MGNKGNLANSGARRTPSLLCLFALLLFQAPVIGAAVLASGLCCSGNHCPIAAHHHSAAKTEEAPMDCNHNMSDRAASLRTCSMSCCSTTEQSALHAQVFVLSPDLAPLSFVRLSEAVPFLSYDEEIGVFSPLSPPPKSLPGLI